MLIVAPVLSLAAVVAGFLLPLLAGLGPAPTLDGREWALYRERFVTAEGRVRDTGNGGISHSEGQGYALLLAVAFGDAVTFERLWRWTRGRLQVREDHLFAWKWEPAPRGDEGAVADRNSASDGDLLIAWALARAGEVWAVPRYTEEARAIARDVRTRLIRWHDGRALLLPGPEGFVHDGVPTVNLSYWVFPALRALDRIDPDPIWRKVAEAGLELLAEARFSRHELPPDWLKVGRPPVPSPRYPPQFGFNAVRIPLHLIWAGIDDRHLLAPFDRFWQQGGGDAVPPAAVDLVAGTATPYPASRGVRAIAALTHRALGGGGAGPVRFPDLDRDTDYFAGSLLLLAKVAYSERFEP